jgi:nucleoside-diphosphate-sugar epimerase
VTRPVPDLTIVTGAAGWFGTALLHRLTEPEGQHARPGRIRAFVADDEGAARVAGISPRIEPVVGDVASRHDVARLFDGAGPHADVIHAAGVIHPANVGEFHRVNAVGTARVVDAATAAGVRRLVHVSSNSPFGTNAGPADVFRNEEPYQPYLGYGRSKMHGELTVLAAVRQAGLDAVVVRPPWFYGPWQPARQTTFFRLVRTGRFPVFGRGDQRRSMVYVDNLVDAVLAAELSTRPVSGRGYWIADARPYTVAEIVRTVQEALRAEGVESVSKTVHLPSILGTVAEKGDRFLQRLGRYQQQLHVLGEMNKTIACDISVATAELGYEPRVALAEGMRRSIRWCLDQGIEL